MSSQLPKPVVAALLFLCLALLIAVFLAGVAVQRYKLPLYGLINEIELAVQVSVEKTQGKRPWWFRDTAVTEPVNNRDGRAADSGANLVSAMGEGTSLVLKLVDMAGEDLHSWHVDWFEVWPEPPGHLPTAEVPKARPGAQIHGAHMFDDGRVVFNFERMSMVMMDACGEVLWKLPYRSHHSIYVDEAGTIWASGQNADLSRNERYPLMVEPVFEPEIVQVSQDGEILSRVSVMDLLDDNGLNAYLYMRAETSSNRVKGDTLHLNDVDVFPGHLEEGLFKHGDVMLSLRNINTVLVYDPQTLQVKWVKTGGFVRQHDPDFVDGNTITLFDNNAVGPDKFDQQSRIIKIDAVTDEIEVVYEGSAAEPFYTRIMGKHQWLDNGHLLVSDSQNGRGFELNTDGEIVWEFFNLAGEGQASSMQTGAMQEIARYQQMPAFLSGTSCNQ